LFYQAESLNRTNEGQKMIYFKEETIYASYHLIGAAIRKAARLQAMGATCEVRKVGNVYMVIGI
jgi:hypothetical protein